MTPDDLQLRFSRNLKTVRTERNLSLETLANQCGVDLALLNGIEAGTCETPISALFHVAAAIQVDYRRLLVDARLNLGSGDQAAR